MLLTRVRLLEGNDGAVDFVESLKLGDDEESACLCI